MTPETEELFVEVLDELLLYLRAARRERERDEDERRSGDVLARRGYAVDRRRRGR